MKYIVIIFFLTQFLLGCASQVKQPVANLPLVDIIFSTVVENVPQKLWPQLNRATVGEIMVINDDQLIISQQYYSASGRQCVHLKNQATPDKGLQSKTVCRETGKGSWFFAKAIISHYSNSTN